MGFGIPVATFFYYYFLFWRRQKYFLYESFDYLVITFRDVHTDMDGKTDSRPLSHSFVLFYSSNFPFGYITLKTK